MIEELPPGDASPTTRKKMQNRIACKQNRRKNKEYVKHLEEKVEKLEDKVKYLTKELEKYKHKVNAIAIGDEKDVCEFAQIQYYLRDKGILKLKNYLRVSKYQLYSKLSFIESI